MLAEKPVFLIGGFGGSTEIVINALKNESVPELEEYYLSSSSYNKFYNSYNFNNETKIDYKALKLYFAKVGVNGLKNGLSIEDNYKLFLTTNITEIIRLVLEGLRELKMF